MLVRLGEFGALVTRHLSAIAEDERLVGNVPIVVLCRLDLEGPLRPNEIAELEHMTTGGISKLLDKLESDGLVERQRGAIEADQRAVLVAITPEGRSLARRMGDAFTDLLVDAEALIEGLNRALGLAKADR